MSFSDRLRQLVTARDMFRGSRTPNRRGRHQNLSLAEGLETRALLATFTVTNLNDSGVGSLRQAVSQANAAAGADTILISAPGEILLTSGQIAITNSVSITGNGTTNSVINAQRQSRIFDISSAAGNVTLTKLTLLNGRTTAVGEEGGALRFLSSGTLTINQSTLSGNSTAGTGSPADIFNSRPHGGAIYTRSGNIVVNGSTISNNSTEGDYSNGGAIYSVDGDISISQSVVTGNSTAGESSTAGAIGTDGGAITITESRISGNSTLGKFSSGGALYTYDGAIRISRSTFSGNSTRGDQASGGAIATEIGAITMSQSTLSGNSTAGDQANGGGIHSYAGSVEISQSTVTKNTAFGAGGGIEVFGFPTNPVTYTITNSIVAGNKDNGTGPDVMKGKPVFPFLIKSSLIGRNNGISLTATIGTTPDANGNIVGGNTVAKGIDPRLAPLADNGGPTQTHAILPSSPALNRGNNTLALDITQAGSPLLANDQRGAGFFRVLSGTVDMGAFEARTLDGSAAADVFRLRYSGSSSTGTVNVTASFGGAPFTSIGTFPMKSPLTIDGAGGADTVQIVGTTGVDTLTVSSAGLVTNGSTLYLRNTENRTLSGMDGNDVYRFDADAAIGLLTLDESAGGSDTIDFSLTTTVGVNLNLATAATQIVHATNLSLILGSGTSFENATGGAVSDTLIGNSLPNRLSGGSGNNVLVGLNGADSLIGGTGRDILIGGLGLDTLNGDAGDDILIAGRTTSDTSFGNLSILRTAWISSASYTSRISNLRSGVGSPAVSLKAKINVLNDAGEDDLMTGGTGTDWYFRAVDDMITDLFVGEFSDLL